MVDTARLLEETLELVAPGGEANTMVVGEALRNAGDIEVPADIEAFRRFVEGPLRLAATDLLGAERAQQLQKTLLAVTSALTKSAGGTLPPEQKKQLTPPSGVGWRDAARKLDADGVKPHETLPYGKKRK